MSPVSKPSQGTPPPRVVNDDVLYEIARALPTGELARVNSANTVFHSEHLRRQYASVVLDKRDKDSKKLLLHLGDQDARVACRVTRVEIKPWLVEPRTKSPQSLTENVIIWFSQLIDPHYTQKVAEQRLQKRLDKDILRSLSAFKEMVNLEEYKITWDDDPRYHPEFYRNFLAPSLELWANHLVKLTIKVPLKFLNSLARVNLPKLQILCYTFSTGRLSAEEIQDAHEGFIVFVNNTKSSLRTLSFTSTNTSDHLDMSRIFRHLGAFPCLRVVSLSIPYDGAHLAEPLLFVQFLERSRRLLRELNLYANLSAFRHVAGNPKSIEWVQQILGAIQTPLPRLRRLGVAVRPLRHPFDTLIRFLSIHAATLNSLKLMDRSMTGQDLGTLLAADTLLAPSLVFLHMKVDVLSPILLAGIASLCPNLETLQMECHCISGGAPRNVDGRGSLLEWSEYLKHPYVHKTMSDWKLKKFALSLPNFSWAGAIAPDLHESLPSLSIMNLKAITLPHGQFIY